VDRHRCDVDPDPYPTFHFDAVPDSDPDPNPYPSFTRVGNIEHIFFYSQQYSVHCLSSSSAS
jgi:hypothetical protein